MSPRTGRPRTGRDPNFSIRIKPGALQIARDAAKRQHKTIGKWLEEAINDKVMKDEQWVDDESGTICQG